MVALLEMMSDAERAQLLEGWNETEREYPKDRCLHELFEDQVAKTPDAVAVVHGSEELTYAELNGKANQLAHYLRKQGVEAGEYIPLLMSRCVEMVVAQLAVLKSGCAYVPIDPEFPEARRAFMIQDCHATHVITAEHLPVDPSAAGVHWINLSQANEVITHCLHCNVRQHLDATDTCVRDVHLWIDRHSQGGDCSASRGQSARYQQWIRAD